MFVVCCFRTVDNGFNSRTQNKDSNYSFFFLIVFCFSYIKFVALYIEIKLMFTRICDTVYVSVDGNPTISPHLLFTIWKSNFENTLWMSDGESNCLQVTWPLSNFLGKLDIIGLDIQRVIITATGQWVKWWYIYLNWVWSIVWKPFIYYTFGRILNQI